MIRTQIYLTAEEKQSLNELAERTGRSQSQLIREAIDAYIIEQTEMDQDEIMARAAGLWRDREDLPDFEALRSSLDREFGL